MSWIEMSTMFYRARGFSLIELMIAMTLGLIIVAVVTTVFVDNSRTLRLVDESVRHLENGRYAVQRLRNDIRLAGFYSEYDSTPLSTPTTKPDPCSSTIADIAAALPIHIQGYDNSDGGISCLSSADVKANTDVLVIRRTSTCAAGEGTCAAAAAGNLYFQASLCNVSTELGSAMLTDHFALDSDIGSTTSLTKHKRNCTDTADLRRMRVHIYFVANNGVGNDGIPTLKRWELDLTAASGGVIVPLVEGIEDLQLEYGIDTDGDGAPDAYTAAPESYGDVPGSPGTSCSNCYHNWRDIMTVRMHLLARAIQPDPQYTDTKIYQMGRNADGTARTAGAFNDNFRRNQYNALVVAKNVAGRREQ